MGSFDRAECEQEIAALNDHLREQEEDVMNVECFNPIPLASALQSALAEIDRLTASRDAVGKLLEKNGCDCECDHCRCDHCRDDHDEDCDRCFPCRVEAALFVDG